MVSAVYRGDEAKPSVQTCTCVHRTCNGYGVTGDRYGVGQSHPRCDPCYPLNTLTTTSMNIPASKKMNVSVACSSIRMAANELHPIARTKIRIQLQQQW